MKRIQKRSSAALLLALLLLLGNGVLIWKLASKGGDWAAYSANLDIYSPEGVLGCGTLTDRNGVLLADNTDGEIRYAEDDAVRLGSVHAVGDYRGHIGTGALKIYARELTGYDLIFGTTRARGQTVALTLDAELQAAAWTALKSRTGSILVSNYETGEILALVSAPSYDPYAEPDEDVEGLFLNRALSGVYAPGSVFKMVTLCAALENIPDLYERTFVCTGVKEVSGGRITCAAAHGQQTIEKALANSCNCAFGALALELGGDTLQSYADALGFTSAHSLDGARTAAGSFEAAEARDSYLAWSGIGQHKDMVNPYAMLRFLSAAAAGGTLREPTLLLGNTNKAVRLLRQETAEAVGEMMSYTFTTRYAPGGAFPGLDLCAKTGTAELGDGSSHAWFVGWCRSGPPLAFVVCIERGGAGFGSAGSAANAVLQKAAELYGE